MFIFFLFFFNLFYFFIFFFFNDTATTEIYTLSLHDALPISCGFAGLWIYVATHAPALGAAVPPEALRQSIPGFTGGLLAYVAGTLIAAFSAVAALIIFGLLAVYYLFEHLPSPAEAGPGDSGSVS